MAPPNVQSTDVSQFYGDLVGLSGPIDLSGKPMDEKEAGKALITAVEQIRTLLVAGDVWDEPGSSISMSRFVDRPVRMRVYFDIAGRDKPKKCYNLSYYDRFDCRSMSQSISERDIAVSLVDAGLLILPDVVHETPTPLPDSSSTLMVVNPGGEMPVYRASIDELWNNKGMLYWKIENQGMSWGLLDKWLALPDLDHDDLVFAIDRLNVDASREPPNEFVDRFMNNYGPDIRAAFVKHFRIKSFNGGQFFGNSADPDFDSVMNHLTGEDATTIQEMVESNDPHQISLGLLMAAKVFDYREFKDSREIALRDPEMAKTIIFTEQEYFDRNAGPNSPILAQQSIGVSLKGFSDYLLQAYFGDFSTCDYIWVSVKSHSFSPFKGWRASNRQNIISRLKRDGLLY